MNQQGTIIKFTGYSDDGIEVEIIHPATGVVTHDVISPAIDEPTKILVHTIGGARGCYVLAMYDGCWWFAVRQLEEGRRIPFNWEFSIDQDDDVAVYSVRLTVDAFKHAGDILDKPKRIYSDPENNT